MPINVSPSRFVQYFAEEFALHGDPVRAIGASKYMRNLFPFFGIPSPERKDVTKRLLGELGTPTSEEMSTLLPLFWSKSQREFHYAAQDLLFAARKTFTPRTFDLIQFALVNSSWWDTVDFLSSKCVGTCVKMFPKEGMKWVRKWRRSSDMWLNRTSIIFQLTYKAETDSDFLFETCKIFSGSNEFFIQKAIGWSLRQYAYTDLDSVKSFVTSQLLKPLSVREGAKHWKHLL